MFASLLTAARFPKLVGGALTRVPACALCDPIYPLCDNGSRRWKEMEATLALLQGENPAIALATETMHQRSWAVFNHQANGFLHHLGAGVPSYAYAHIPPECRQNQHCPTCRQTTTWLWFWEYQSGTRRLVCGPCAERQACQRAALVWKLERGIRGKNAWIFQRVRQWITEDGCDAATLLHLLDQWQQGFQRAEPACQHCREARGIVVADVNAPYMP